MFKDLKFDMPALVVLVILILFAQVVLYLMYRTGSIDADVKQTLFALVMLAAGYYLGTSNSSSKKDAPLIAQAQARAEQSSKDAAATPPVTHPTIVAPETPPAA